MRNNVVKLCLKVSTQDIYKKGTKQAQGELTGDSLFYKIDVPNLYNKSATL